jgi:hypothetical protein
VKKVREDHSVKSYFIDAEVAIPPGSRRCRSRRWVWQFSGCGRCIARGGDDYFIIDSNITFAQGSPPFPTGAGASLAAVPEPALVGLALLAPLMTRRGRRRD